MKTAIAASLLFLASVSAVSAQDPGWPRKITKPQGTLVYYQPQVENWNNFQELDWREAITITPSGGKEIVGAVSMHGLTSVNSESQMVLISNLQVKNTYFPSLSPADAAGMDQLVRTFVPQTVWSAVSKDGESAYSQHYTTAQGTTGSVQTSSGGKAVGASGAYGNSASAGKTASGNMYASADGNVYKNTGSGWQKAGSNGSWNSVNSSSAEQHPSSTSSSAYEQHPSSSSYHPSSSEMQGMQQEAQNRERGEQSSQRYAQQSSSGGWGRRSGSSSGGGGWGGRRR